MSRVGKGILLLAIWVTGCVAVIWHMSGRMGSQVLGLRVVAARPLPEGHTLAVGDVELELHWGQSRGRLSLQTQSHPEARLTG
jgi:hypothetical protein